MSGNSDTRQRILNAALELFRTKGFHAVGTQEICEKAEVHKGTLYHFFPTKLDIAITVIQDYGASSEREFQEMVSPKFGPARRLARLFALEYRCAQEQVTRYGQVTGCFHNTLGMELAAVDARAREVLERVAQSWAKILEPTIQELIDSGEIPATDVSGAARLVFALISGSVLAAKLQNSPDVILQMGRSVLRLLGGSKLAPKA